VINVSANQRHKRDAMLRKISVEFLLILLLMDICMQSIWQMQID